MDEILVGYEVHKTSGDYKFDGTVIAIITKKNGMIRYAVEDDRGLILIMNRGQLND